MAPDGAVPVSGVCEIVLEQSDLAAAEEFYVDVLGFPVVERWSTDAVWVMAGDRTRIGLWRPQIGLGGGRGGVHVHYAMGLPAQAYEAMIGRLRSRGNIWCSTTTTPRTATGVGAPHTSPTPAAM